jgi:glycosidase
MPTEFARHALQSDRPESVRPVELPRRTRYHPSPADWRDEVLYFLLVDRFSDGLEAGRPLVDRDNLPAARPAGWRWDAWAASGGDRWQGGTLKGVASKLDYLAQLGVTAIWLSPVFKQRGHLDSFHGYGVQDFLDVDPRFGTRGDLVDLVAAAHERGIRVILDVIFNHSGSNWLYPEGTPGGRHTPHYTAGRYPFGEWAGDQGQPVGAVTGSEEGAWPRELQDPERYTRAGSGGLGSGSLDDPAAELRRSDFISLRDFALAAPGALSDLARCYKYWIALTDCDGFRIDTLKHVSFEEARNFCGTIKEFAAGLGKASFFLAGEIAGGDYAQDRYLDVLDRNLDAALDIGEMRLALNALAKGLLHPHSFFSGFDRDSPGMGSHRNFGGRHVSILDDHDHVFGAKLRFSSEAASAHQVAAGVAIQLFTLGIPCIYYGTEQSLGGPEATERRWLPGWGGNDRYLREAMFGPEHPRASGRAGLSGALDGGLPGFGPFGTAGRHCFDTANPVFDRIAAMLRLRAAVPALRQGRQYLRPTSFLGRPWAVHGPGELLAWSRILDDEEVLCAVNVHGTEQRGAAVLVDAELCPPGSTLTVLLNSAEGASPAFGGNLQIEARGDGAAFVEIAGLPPSETVVLTNRP